MELQNSKELSSLYGMAASVITVITGETCLVSSRRVKQQLVNS